MKQASRAVAVSRYERLLSQLDTELYTTLEALHIHPSALALPAPPLRSSAEVPDIFASFGIPERQVGTAAESCSHTHLEDAPKGLPKFLVRDLLAAAGNEEHSGGENKSTRDEQPQQPRTDRPLNRHIPAGHEPSPPVFFDEDPSPSPSIKRTPHPEKARTAATPRRTHGIERREESEDLSEPQPNAFRTARSRLPAKRTLRGGLSRAGPSRPSAPAGRRDSDGEGNAAAMAATRAVLGGAKRARFSAPRTSQPMEASVNPDLPEIPNVDAKLVEMIMNEMLDRSPGVEWDDIAGLHFAKRSVMEAVVWPMKRPDIFSGLRGPPKGLLLFGPPGTGKTLIGRAIASRSGAKFFNISASSLMSKWVGEGEKLVRALFAVARVFQPSVVFIDEIDSLLTQRTDGEQESSRRVKTEFLVQMDGAGTSREDRVLVVGATNRPQELDEAARRRLVKRLYIPLPDKDARCSLVKRLLQKQTNSLTEEDLESVAELSKGYSGSDMYALCAEAALGPVRDLGESIGSVEVDSVRPVSKRDFEIAVRMVRASVSDNDLTGYLAWNETFGSFPTEPSTLPTADVNGK